MGKPYGRIYLITNTITGKVYVGQTKQTLGRRWSEHKAKRSCRRLSDSIKKHGPDKFTIQEVATATSSEELNTLETFWIRWLKSNLELFGYNLMLGGDVRTPSEETRKKISEAHKGRRLSEEHRRKLSESHKGHKPSPETRARMSEALKGVPRSEETRKKISEAQKGRPSTTKGRKSRPLTDVNYFFA